MGVDPNGSCQLQTSTNRGVVKVTPSSTQQTTLGGAMEEAAWSCWDSMGPAAKAIIPNLDEEWLRLLERLEREKHAFLLSDAEDPDAIIVMASEPFCQLSGYNRDEVVGQNCRFLQGADTELKEVAKIRKALLDGTSASVTVTNYRKDNKKFENQFLLLPLTCDSVIRYFIGIQCCPQDIVQQYAAKD